MTVKAKILYQIVVLAKTSTDQRAYSQMVLAVKSRYYQRLCQRDNPHSLCNQFTRVRQTGINFNLSGFHPETASMPFRGVAK